MVQEKGASCLTLGFGFLDSQIKHVPSLRIFKIHVYVVDQKPQIIISFFPVYTKLCSRKRGFNDKVKRKNHSGCNIS